MLSLCGWDQVRVGLLSWHTVGVVTERAMVLPSAVMPGVTGRATGKSMVRALTAPWPMETRGVCRDNQ